MKGSRYSLLGYINAVLRRSSKTIIVEGVADQTLLKRLLIERGDTSKVSPFIDVSDIVDDDALSGLGARVRVLSIKQTSKGYRDATERLGTLTDREWDGLLDDAHQIQLFTPPNQGSNDFVTFGHSIENYAFDLECVISFVRFQFAEYYTQQLEQSIREMYPAAITFAAVYSVEMSRRSLVGKANSILTPELLEVRDGAFALSSTADAVMASRTIAEGGDIITSVNSAVKQLAYNHNLAWFVHGHLGENALWAAIGKIAAGLGLIRGTVLAIASPTSRERDRFWRTWLATTGTAERTPLDQAVGWVLEPL